jgi:hypothetical protein
MRIGDAFPSRYLKASDIPLDEEGNSTTLVLTIKDVKVETLGQGPDAQQKPVLYFHQTDKGLVCNKTNAKALTELFRTDDTDDWIGKKVGLFVADVQFKDEMVESIRIKKKAPTGPPSTMPIGPARPDEVEYVPQPAPADPAAEDCPF